MAWDAKSVRDSRKRLSLPRLFKSKKELAVGDAFPKLDFSSPSIPVAASDPPPAMDLDGINLSPISEEHFSPPPRAPLAVHVTIQYTDPVIRSRYSRSYTSSHTFEPTNRICNGLLRRIDHCSKELLTRKDSTALDQYKDGTHERKCMRFEITFCIVRRGVGKWAERRFRSYQKQPLTVALTKDIQLATHRIVGLFLRRHDKDFQWLDGSIVDHSPEAPETVLPSSDVGLSLLCVPRSRFIESRQSFEFVPGYTIQLSFRSRNPTRPTQVVKSTIKVESSQPAPLSLLMSEEIQWRGLQAINRGLEERKRDLYNHINVCRTTDCCHSEDDALQIELSITNNLGIRHHVYRDIKSNFALFRDPEARDCNEFIRSIKKSLVEASEYTDAEVNKLDDFEFNVVELKGRNWSVKNPLMFSQGPSASYGRRTVQAALDRIQTGIGDVLRGNNVAVHISAYKRGHHVLDKALVAHEKRGRPREIFSSTEEQRTAFLTRLKMRIERDMEMVFKDTCSIDDILDDDEDDFPEQQRSPGPEAGHFEARSGSIRSTSPTMYHQRFNHESPQSSPTKPAVQRAFSLGGRSVSSAASIISARNLDEFRSIDMVSESGSRRSSFVQDQPLEERLSRDTPSPSPSSPMKPQRRFSLLPRSYSAQSTRVSNASTLICETPGLLEESPEINVGRDISREERTVKVEMLKTDKIPEIDCLPDDGKVNSMTLNDVADSNTREAAGMVPEPAFGILESGPSPRLLSHAEVIAQEEAADMGYFQGLELEQEGDKTQTQCDNVDVGGESEAIMDYNRHQHTIMDAFQDAQEYPPTTGLLHAMSLAAPAKVEGGFKSPGMDEYSTAPSTPALSLGGDSSPRPSLLATPSSYLQEGEKEMMTGSGTKGDENYTFEPESDTPEEVDEMADTTEPATDASGSQPRSTETPSDFGDEFGLGDSIEPATEQVVADPEPDLQQQEERIDSPAIDNSENSGPDNESPQSDAASDVTEAGEPSIQDQPTTVPSGDTEPLAAEPTTASGDYMTCSDHDEPPTYANVAAKEPQPEPENQKQQSPAEANKNEIRNLGPENVEAGTDLGDSDPPDIQGGEVRSDAVPVSVSDCPSPEDDFYTNLRSEDNAQDGTEAVESESESPDGANANVVRLDSDANPFLLLVDEVAEAAHGPEDLRVPAGFDSEANPFVVLVDEVTAGPAYQGNDSDGAEGELDSAGAANKDDLEGPGWTRVGTAVPAETEGEGIVPEEETGASGFKEPEPTPTKFIPEVGDFTSERTEEKDVHGPEQPFVAPTGSAVVDLEADILAAVAINNLISGGEEMFKVGTGGDVFDEPAETESAAAESEWNTNESSPEPESQRESEAVAPEEEEKEIEEPRPRNIDASPQTDGDQFTLNQDVPVPAPEEEKEAEILAASDSVADAAADPDSYPDDISQPEVARLQASLLGEDYDLRSSTGPESTSEPTAVEGKEEEQEAEILAASDSVGAAAADPDTYPDDIGQSEVARLQTGLLGEDYDLASTTGPEFDSVPAALEDGDNDQGTENNQNVDQTEGRFPGVVVGVLDPNIGTDPEANVVFQVIADGNEGDLRQDQEQYQERASSRRAPELGEDICGHEYPTGSNRVGYAAVCLSGPPEADGTGSEAAASAGNRDQDFDEDEALAKGDRPTEPVDITDKQTFITDPSASLSSQVDEVPPVVVEVIKQVLTGQLSEPDGAARHGDDIPKAATGTETTDVSACFSRPETETQGPGSESTPAILTITTDDDVLSEMAENPPTVVVDLIKRVLAGGCESEYESSLPPDEDDKESIGVDIQAEPDKLEREIEHEAELALHTDDQLIQDELDQLKQEMQTEVELEAPGSGSDVLSEMSEPARTVVMVLGQEGPEQEEIPTGMPEPAAAGPEETTSKTEAQFVEEQEASMPRVIPVPVAVAVPDISNLVRDHPIAAETPASAGAEDDKGSHVSVRDFEVPASVPSSHPDLVSSLSGDVLPEAADAGEEGPETPKPKPSSLNISVEDTQASSSTSSSTSRVAIPELKLDYDTAEVGISARGSVDTIRRSFDTDSESDSDNEPYPKSRPQTAGYLGLGDAHRRFKVLGAFGAGSAYGMNGKLGATNRRNSLPLHYLLDSSQQENYQCLSQDGATSPVSGGGGWRGKGRGKGKGSNRSPRTTWAKLMGLEQPAPEPEGQQQQEEEEKKHKHRHHRKHVEQPEDVKKTGEEETRLTEESSAEQAIYDGPTVVPRMMMLLAGVVAVGKIIKGPGNY